ncbi:MAG: AAA family ATPase [Lachnospiraceae bacterium]|nr:AAA family ATPase [Lachnospiraceae bacterium]
MILKDVTAKNFGQFQDKTITFDPGLNVIYGENESGKTTLHTFIRGMLFGIRKLRGRAAKTDVYSRYEPWENEHYYAGSMRMESGGKTFRLSRSFQKTKPKSELICETDGETLSVEHGDLDMLLGGMSETVYDNTVSIGQLKSQTDDGLVVELRNYMANYQGSGDGDLNIQEALDTLKKRKKEQETLKRQGEQERESRKRELSTHIDYIQDELEDAKRSLSQKQNEILRVEAQQRREEERRQAELAKMQEQERLEQQKKEDQEQQRLEAERQQAAAESQRKIAEQKVAQQRQNAENMHNSRRMAVTVAIAVLAFIGCMFAPDMMWKTVIIVAAAVVILALFIISNRKWKKSPKSVPEPEEETEPERAEVETDILEAAQKELEEQQRLEALQREKEEQQRQRMLEKEKLRWSMERYQEDIQEKTIQLENVQEDYQVYCEAEIQASPEEEDLQAIQMATQHIADIAVAMQQAIGEELKTRMSEILCELTEGRYEKIQIDENFNMGVHSSEHYIPLEHLSRGTIEQVYFALRMAVSQILCEDEPMPVLLDDVFAMYDEKRLMQALRWLAKQKQQVLIFTCHKREKELLDKMQLNYSYHSLR